MQDAYSDDGALRPQDQIALSLFLSTQDRAKLLALQGVPFFSGRESEINVFRRALIGLEQGLLADATIAVEGPPGAGKTALMAQCIGEVAMRPPTPEGREWLPVIVEPDDTNSPEALGRTIDRAIAKRLASTDQEQTKQVLADIARLVELAPKDQAQEVREAAEVIRRAAKRMAAVPGDEINAVMDRTAQNLTALLPRIKSAGRAILDRGFSITGFSVGAAQATPNVSIADVASARGGGWNPYQIAIFVDEAQMIPVQNPNTGQPSSVLYRIHQGRAGAALSLCVFGLPGTSEALADAGISRTVAERSMRLGPLDPTDCEKAARRCFQQFQVANAEGWVESIVARSGEWPQHLAGYLVAAMSEIGEHPRPHGGYDAAQASLERAIAAGDTTRQQYYEQRRRSLAQAGQLQLARRLAPELRANGLMSEERLQTAISEVEPGCTKEERREFIQAAIHAGFVEERQDGYAMPIPSFAAHLLNEPQEPLPTNSGTPAPAP